MEDFTNHINNIKEALEETMNEMYQYETTYQSNDFFRVSDGVKTFIFNKSYIISIEADKKEIFEESVIVRTSNNHTYTLKMKIDDFIDQMEGRK